MIDNSKKQDIINATSIVDVVGRYVKLKKAGKDYNGLCPFHDEKTPSFTVSPSKKIFKCFGCDAGGNVIDYIMKEEDLSFPEACKMLADEANIELSGVETKRKAVIEYRNAKTSEKEGDINFDIKKKMTDKELSVLGPWVTHEVCEKFNVFSLKSYTKIKDRKAIIIKSNDDFPIFLFEKDKFGKIYQPYAKKSDKGSFKFQYYGEKTEGYVNGLDILIKEHTKEDLDAQEQAEKDDKDYKGFKFKEVVLASGDRDALNAAGAGYKVVWLNSETATLEPKTVAKLFSMAERVINIPDIDDTGIKQGKKVALKYINICTAWLPFSLKKLNKKDLTDFAVINKDNKKAFHNLVSEASALPSRFWDENYKDGHVEYYVNNEHLYYFLRLNGFYTFKLSEKETVLIRVRDHKVKRVEIADIVEFLKHWFRQRLTPVPLRNVFHRSPQLSEKSLLNLDEIKLNFKDFEPELQYLFFEDQVWEISKKTIKKHKPGSVSRYVWEEEILPFKPKLSEKPPFELKIDGNGTHKLQINDDRCLVFQFLSRTSEMYWMEKWKSEQEGKPFEYTEEQKQEHERHLMNKIFSIGYLLHRYKHKAKAWCVFAMDNKISEDGSSHGGSGKSLTYQILRHFMNTKFLSGKDKKITRDNHIFEGINQHTDFLLIDDTDKYFYFEFFYNIITGDMNVNPKGKTAYNLYFEDVPKLGITTNYTIRNTDPSTNRRLLYTVFSDYYHDSGENNEYASSWSPYDEFGVQFPGDKELKNTGMTYDQINQFYNTVAACIQFYLGCTEKITPPMANVEKRNLLFQMGNVFLDWASAYFAPEGENVNKLILRQEAFLSFHESNPKKWTAQYFSKALQAFCLYQGYELNPDHIPDVSLNKEGRIIKWVDGKTQEKIYIHVPENINEASDDDDDGEYEDLPF